MKFARILMLLTAAGAMYGQSWDNSGNSLLNGTYYFRQVYYLPITSGTYQAYLSEAVTIYGGITFDGNGNYSISTSNGAMMLDYSFYYGQTEAYANCTAAYPCFTATGTYSIASSGYGFITSPYATGDLIYGLVSANGVFVGSSTDNSYGYNDMLVAAPLASPAPNLASFTGSWSVADLDLSGGTPTYGLSLMFSANPDGKGDLNVGLITGYTGGSTSMYTQTASGLKYIFSSGAAVATFPTNGTLIAGQKYLYFSPDGNFMFGGSPITSNTPFDMIVGVKTTANPTASGLYYQAGLDQNASTGDLDSYFGSVNVIAGAAPQTYLEHQRVNDFGGTSVYDYTDDATLSLSGDTANNTFARYVVGAGGAEAIASGISPYLGLKVALQAPTTTGTGVFLNPQGIVNAGSNAPFTTGIAPGELLTLYGSNLAGSTKVAGIPFPTSLGNVQVNIGGYPSAIYYVSSGQIAAIVPYEVSPGSIVDIQVTNDMGSSNVVTNYVANTAPGVLTQNQNGTGYGDILDQNYALVTAANPAVEGASVQVYLTGLGAVSPTITDGAPGGSTTLNQTTNTIAVDFAGTAATNDYSGLAPGYSGLYQLNVTVPTGLTVGTNYLDISGSDSYMSYPLIQVSATATSAVTADVKPAADTARPKLRGPANGSPSIRNRQAKKPFGSWKNADKQ